MNHYLILSIRQNQRDAIKTYQLHSIVLSKIQHITDYRQKNTRLLFSHVLERPLSPYNSYQLPNPN